ncbi:MAG: hypothetical protein H7842_14925, partial [Gammaproteobacteria bacterium SHHR-1]
MVELSKNPSMELTCHITGKRIMTAFFVLKSEGKQNTPFSPSHHVFDYLDYAVYLYLQVLYHFTDDG